MTTTLLKGATSIVTMDAEQPMIEDGSILIKDNVIESVASANEVVAVADVVINVEGMLLLPGLINTHHHIYQTLTRALPGAQDQELFDWLRRLYPVWAEMSDEAVYVSAMVGMAEMILSGCTTTTDHLYLFPNDCRLESTIRAADELGMRFHPTRGSMSLGESKGGLPPDQVVQEEDVILKDTQRMIEEYHDPSDHSMVRVGVAPCSPFSVTTDLMKESARLARSFERVNLHTHVAETKDEEVFCLETFGVRPAEYMRQVDWVGPDVWWAHAIWLDDQEIDLLKETDTGVAHCPSSNMRLGSGIAKVREMRDADIRVGIAVDGSASNDGCNVLQEARMAMLLQRVAKGASGFSVMEALELATSGSASVIGRDDLGKLMPGMSADVIGFKLDRLEFAGAAVHDPAAALLLCTPHTVDLSLINGKVIVQEQQILGFDLERVVHRHNQLAREMANKHPWSH
jgi:cytosine/adenosine deaminase-related metal-dependent hydrolase